MLKSHIFRQFALLAINFVIFLASQFCFGQVLELGGHWHAVDHNLKLALSNQDTEILNMLYDESVTSVILKGEVYQFSNPVDTFEIGYPYNVIRNNESYTFYFTKLPVVFVEMNLPLSDDYRRPAEFTIVESNGHFLTSDIGINLRGASSQEYLKKSLRIEFWIDTTGEESKKCYAIGFKKRR